MLSKGLGDLIQDPKNTNHFWYFMAISCHWFTFSSSKIKL